MLRGAAARLMRPLMRPLVQLHVHPCGARVMSSLAGSKTLDSLRDAFVRAYPKHSTCVLPCTATNMPAFPKVLTHCALQAGKAMASVRYAYMAQQADVEGYVDEAATFRAVAESEENHAMGHLEFLQDSGDPVSKTPISNTVEMLESAITGEHHDSTVMYPEFARVAREEGLDDVAEWFETLAVAEGIHLRRFEHLLQEVPNM